MPPALPSDNSRPALVLGGGGAAGVMWLFGLTLGLRQTGIDLSLARRIVGTSAGAVLGANLAGGVDLAALLASLPAEPPASSTPSHDPTRPGAAEPIPSSAAGPGPSNAPESTPPSAVEPIRPGATSNPADAQSSPTDSLQLNAAETDPLERRRRIGAQALELDLGDPADHIARMSQLVGITDWPDHDLLITAVDATTGELRTWTRDGKATLPEAIAASSAIPGVFPAIPIDGSHFLDGGLRSPINADLAAGAPLIVILEPFAHVFRRAATDRELAGAPTISITADTPAITAFGSNLFDPAALRPAFEAGLRQAAEASTRLRDVWPASR
ncbi:patatin-like phospholipase family protein [Nocardia sp. NPDC088792]|uniref:patatin-like phospholipase family protein n=1 Tax=Nocardia sp. NPDC088792 TaxID=3364332 RepID=UPI00380FAD83